MKVLFMNKQILIIQKSNEGTIYEQTDFDYSNEGTVYEQTYFDYSNEGIYEQKYFET